mmetsp:Transcript_680/g.1846  ORF Transcript_680/g.1846 Transcript_680/m.1846 type:complete len:487 (+) Transcript_680:931-2391(+)
MQLNIVLYGDSITEDLASMGSVLDLYRQDYRMDAFGISGDTSSNLLWRLQNGEFPKNTSPHFVVLHVGVNDILHKFEDEGRVGGSDEDSLVQNIVGNILDMAAYIQTRSCRSQIMLQAILPTAWETSNKWPNRYSRVINTVNKRLESEVGGYDNVHYLDCTDLFLEGSGQRQIRTDYMKDLLHPTETGHKALAKCMLQRADDVFQAILERSAFLVFGDWRECSAPCGGGYQVRKSQCQLESEFISGLQHDLSRRVAKDVCHSIAASDWDLVRVCNTNPCGAPDASYVNRAPEEASHSALGGSPYGNINPRPHHQARQPPGPQGRQHGPRLVDWFQEQAGAEPNLMPLPPVPSTDPNGAPSLQRQPVFQRPDQASQPPAVMWRPDNSSVRNSPVFARISDEQQRKSGNTIPQVVIGAVSAIAACVGFVICGGAAALFCVLKRLRQEQPLHDVSALDAIYTSRHTPVERDACSAAGNLTFRKNTEGII